MRRLACLGSGGHVVTLKSNRWLKQSFVFVYHISLPFLSKCSSCSIFILDRLSHWMTFCDTRWDIYVHTPLRFSLRSAQPLMMTLLNSCSTLLRYNLKQLDTHTHVRTPARTLCLASLCPYWSSYCCYALPVMLMIWVKIHHNLSKHP